MRHADRCRCVKCERPRHKTTGVPRVVHAERPAMQRCSQCKRLAATFVSGDPRCSLHRSVAPA